MISGKGLDLIIQQLLLKVWNLKLSAVTYQIRIYLVSHIVRRALGKLAWVLISGFLLSQPPFPSFDLIPTDFPSLSSL